MSSKPGDLGVHFQDQIGLETSKILATFLKKI